MRAIDQDGNELEIKLETRIVNPFLIDGIEVITKVEQDLMKQIEKKFGQIINEHIEGLYFGNRLKEGEVEKK